MYDQEKAFNWFLATIIGVVTILMLRFLPGFERNRHARNAVDQRNHQRDRIECESKGGFLGEGGYRRQNMVYSVCHDVDSLITLTGDREFYRSP